MGRSSDRARTEAGIGSTHIAVGPEDQLGFSIPETLVSLARALAVVREHSSKTDAYRIAEHLCNEDVSVFESGQHLNVDVDGLLIAGLAEIAIQAWLDHEYATVGRVVPALDFCVIPGDLDREREVIGLVCSCLGGMLHRAIGEESAAERVSQSLESLARTLTVMDQRAEACACAISASNWISDDQRAELLRSLPLAIELARTTAQHGVLVGLQLRYAAALARTAAEDPSLRLDAFDAVESAVKTLPADPHVRNASLALLRDLVTMDFLEELRIPLALNLARAGDDAAAGDPRYAGGSIVVDVGREDLATLLTHLLWAREVEDARHSLDPRPETTSAEASWATWSFRHRAYERAVPRGSSILREREMDQLLLVLAHETIHVVSMASGIGVALSALRAAVVDLELTLWTFVGASESLSREELLVDGLAPLKDGNVLALAQAEQELELVRKTQTLEALWAPWLEGIAVFGELADDPRDDPDQWSPIVQMTMNLVDADVNGDSARQGRSIEQVVRSEQEAAELRYSQAIHAIGHHRLRAYCDRYRTKYLPGYLAARRIVSAWRRSLTAPLTGTGAFRLLLHATRFGTHECIPHLGLPLEEFVAEARSRFTNWLEELQAISAGDLELALSSSAFGRWVAGRYEPADSSPDDEWLDEALLARFREAKSSLSGALADASRVPAADETTAGVMAAAAHGISHQSLEPSFLVSGFLERAKVYPAVLPIGQVSCPFWLNRPTRSLICLVRTTETDYQHGGSSYDLMTLTLEPDSFQELVDAVTTVRDARIQVTRVAFVAVGGEYQGRNFLAFTYGSWIHVMPVGLMFGADDVPAPLHEAIQWRLTRDDLDRVVDLLTADEGRAIADRTWRWTGIPRDWGYGGEIYPIVPWVARVHALADESRTPFGADENGTASRTTLESVSYDESIVERLLANGLALDQGCDVDLSDVVAALDETARHPAGVDWLEAASEECVGFLFSRGVRGWDVTPPERRDAR